MINRNRKYTKRTIIILFLIQLSIILNREVDSINKVNERLIIIDPESEEKKQINLSLFDSQECLLDKTEAKRILTSYGLGDKEIDENTRFILGKCNPVVLIPGLYSTRLVLTIDCKKFTSKKENLINLRLFCGETLCKNTESEYEEHIMWPALFDSPFQLYVNKESRHSACFGYFFKYHKKDECPMLHQSFWRFFYKETIEQTICLHDPAVKVTFYGATEKTENNSQCGLGAIKNILSVGSQPLKESWVNSGSPKVFQNMFDRYQEMGYRSGFSMAGIPYDFRRFISTNEFFDQLIKIQIEKLYENTGKPVIIVAHSYGCLNTLNKIIQSDSEFLKKIKKFVAVAPPFAGAPKDVEIFLHGSNEFNVRYDIKGYDIFSVSLDEFGQRLALPLTPVAYELRPNSIIYKLFNDNKYKNFRIAITERIKLEKVCRDYDCPLDHIENNSKMFTQLFEHFPNLNNTECLVTELMKNNKYIKLINEYTKNPILYVPHFLPCRNDLYDTVFCPTIKFRKNETDDASIIEALHCNEVVSELDQFDLFLHSCDKDKKQCLDMFFEKYHPYPYLEEKMINLFDKFNKTYSKDFPDANLNMTNYFESKDLLKDKIKKMLDHHGEISKTKNLEIPKVDTIIIYSIVTPTKTAYMFDEKKNLKSFEKLDVLMKGGDGTVPTWSSLLIGLKWLYEKKENNLPYKIQLVEYCSSLSKKDSQFVWNNNKDKDFMAISCDCMDSDFIHNFKKTSDQDCDHGTMIGDSFLIKFVESILQDDSNKEEKDLLSGQRLKSLMFYNITENFEKRCNSMIRDLANKDL